MMTLLFYSAIYNIDVSHDDMRDHFKKLANRHPNVRSNLTLILTGRIKSKVLFRKIYKANRSQLFFNQNQTVFQTQRQP